MKKLLPYVYILLLGLSASLFAQTTPPVETELSMEALFATDSMTCIECSVEPIPSSSERYRQHHKTNPLRSITPNKSIPFEAGLSTNWSGYAAATNLKAPMVGSANAVCGVWAVPTLQPSLHPTYSAVWVGIDGYASNTVEQMGTGHDWINGVQENYAWFEMYPSGMFEIVGFPVNNGDLIGAVVQYMGSGVFKMTMYNYTRQAYTVIPLSNTVSTVAQRSSVEWIVEAPSTNFGILPLAHFNYIPLTYCFAVINGVFGPIGSPNWQHDPLYMVTPSNVFKAVPSVLVNPYTFFVYWRHE